MQKDTMKNMNKPLGIEQKPVANSEIVTLIENVRRWGLEHTGCEPSVSCFHQAVDNLRMALENPPAAPIPKQEDASGDKWFVFDPEGNMETLYDSREAAEKAKNELFDWYQEYAADQGWHEDTGRVLWGRVYQELEVYNSGEKMLFEGEMVDCYRGRWVNREPVPAQAAAIPDWLMEMSNQMRTQDNRGTSHPFFQVRCKEYLPTDPECSADRWEIVGDDGVICAQGDEDGFIDYLLTNHANWCKQWNEENHDEESDRDALESWFDPTGGELPEPLRLIWTQEVEKIVSTHLTEAGALQFINRKQHDYPKLYTYAESAYWSPQLRQLQDWIISLSAPKPDSSGGESC